MKKKNLGFAVFFLAVAVIVDNGGLIRGIQAGDIIVSVKSTDVTSAEDIEKAVGAATKAGRKAILVQIERDSTNRFVALPVGQG